MARVKRGVTSHAKHKKVYKLAKGFRGRRKNTIRTAKAAVEKAAQYAFRDRKRKKRTFRALWIQRINAAVRPFGMTYSVFINGLSKSGITVDRKVLSDLAITEPAAFQAIAEKAKAEIGAPVRHDLQRLYQRPVQVGHHRRPQGAVGSRHHRAGSVPGDRRKGQGRAGGLTAPFRYLLRSIFLNASWPGPSRPSTSSCWQAK